MMNGVPALLSWLYHQWEPTLRYTDGVYVVVVFLIIANGSKSYGSNMLKSHTCRVAAHDKSPMHFINS